MRIAVIPKGSTHEFWKAVHAGAGAAASELGVELVFKGPLKEDDREDQIKVVEDFTTSKVSGIVLAPLDDTALRVPVTNAQQSGVPVLIIDSALKDVETVSFVATDNYIAGKKGGEQMIKSVEAKLAGMNRSRRLILLRYQEGSASTAERERGFIDAIKANPNFQIISDNRYAGATTETAQKEGENLIARFKNPDGTFQADGIFCPNESSAFGMLRALQDAGLAGKVTFVGFDSSTKLIEGLGAGQIDALVVQNPYNMGYLGVKTLVTKLKGGAVEKRIDTGSTVVTKQNMNTPEIQKLLKPPRI